MKIIDLSHTLSSGMPVYPGDDGVLIQQTKIMETDHYNYTRVTSGMHAGTHIDFPKHLTEDKRNAEEFPIDSFIGRGVLLDVRGEKNIGYKTEYEKLVQTGDIVLVFTGFADLYAEPGKYYKEYPVLEDELTDFLVRKKIKILGIDTAAPDKFPFNTHKKLLKEDIFILENLTNLKALVGVNDFEVIAVPLKIQAEASLVRAYAKVME